MKGIIFNLLEQVITAEKSESDWDDLLDDAGLDGAYTSVGNYPHEELLALVKAASQRTGKSTDELVQWFGQAALPLLYDRYPSFFDGHAGVRTFLLTLNDVIHPEVRKLFPGAYAPTFDIEVEDASTLLLGYDSHRGLCSFAVGLIEGAARHFGEEVAVDQPQCAGRGDTRCVLRTRIGSRSGS